MSNLDQVSIIFGGKSPEHSASIESFRHVRDVINSSQVFDIDHIYYVNPDNKVAIIPHYAGDSIECYMKRADVMPYWIALGQMASRKTFVLNLLHGNYGEDGCIQGAASMMSIPGTFGPVLPASLAMSKFHMSKYVAEAHPSAKMPRTLVLSDSDRMAADKHIEEAFAGRDIVVKPNSLGASLFTHRYAADRKLAGVIQDNVAAILEYDRWALVQEYIAGDEYSVGCIQRNDVVVALPVVKIEAEGDFFGHAQKHRDGLVKELVVRDDTETTKTIKQLAVGIFKGLGFKNMCRFDFIVSRDGDIVFLEANPIPGMMRNSIFPKMLNAANMSIIDAIRQFKKNYFSEAARKSFLEYHID
ncbi:D-alanine--D-alanine ligase family protein [Burkholderia latens]|uniref:D-alanine--D-alanine ligase family protein n=1 Tax=Burkholderia latens TaxID=488446 RepID=UPI00158EC018|nr:ATP-grasp domain-containing protein [Burkholderia latens]